MHHPSKQPGRLPSALALAALALALSGCGGSGGSDSPAPPPVATTELGGSVRNLSGSGFLLANNGEALAVPAGATAFQFPRRLAPGAPYRVEIVVHPNGQLCEVANATGTAGPAAPSAIAVDCKTALVTTLAGKQSEGEAYTGPGPQVSLPLSGAIAVDAAGNVYVTGVQERSVRKLDKANTVVFHAGHLNSVGRPDYGTTDGPASTATFSSTYSVAADRAGNVYVADYGRIRRIGSDGVVTTIAGSDTFGEVDGRGAAASFPGGAMNIATGPDGSLYVVPVAGKRIRKVTPDGTVTTLAGGAASAVDGTGASAGFEALSGITVANDGSVYVADTNKIRKVSPLGVVTTWFNARPRIGCAPQEGIGPGSTGACWIRETPVNGPKELATLATPVSLALDARGNLFVADAVNGMIRVITPLGGVSALAGTGTLASSDGPGATATLILPASIATDDKGEIYLLENGHWAAQTYPKIRKITLQ